MVEERHVSNTDKLGKRYRNMANVFTIGDDDDGTIFVQYHATQCIFIFMDRNVLDYLLGS